MMRPDARRDIVERNSNELQTVVRCYFSLLGIDLPTWKLASDAIRETLKSTPKASTAIIYVPLKLEPTNQSVFVDLWNKTPKIV
jgi:hypothetical protein